MVALIDNEEATLKHLKNNTSIVLSPANDLYNLNLIILIV